MRNNLRSESAIKKTIKKWRSVYSELDEADPIIRLCDGNSDYVIAEIDLREFVAKRQPLTGIKSQVAAIVRGKGRKGK